MVRCPVCRGAAAVEHHSLRFSGWKPKESAQEVAQYCATSCALGCRPRKAWPAGQLPHEILRPTAQLLAQYGSLIALAGNTGFQHKDQSGAIFCRSVTGQPSSGYWKVPSQSLLCLTPTGQGVKKRLINETPPSAILPAFRLRHEESL